MKNTIFLFLASLFFGAAAQAQSTADSIAAKYQLQPMPQPLTIEKTFPVLGTYQLNTRATAADGTTSTAATQQVVVTLDTSNKGIVWIEGLPEGRMKAYLKRTPATYRIVAQQTGSGRQIPEGTLIFDPNTNTLNIALGKAYNESDPASIFAVQGNVGDMAAASPVQVKVKSKTASSKGKSKVLFYSALKTEVANSTSTNAAKQ